MSQLKLNIAINTWGEDNESPLDEDADNTKCNTEDRHNDVECKIRGVAVDKVEADVVECERDDDANPHTHAEYASFWKIT